jgi:hypothetical protein
MIDPASIASEAAILVLTTNKLSHSISTLLTKITTISPTPLLVLKVELDTLSSSLGSLSAKFSSALTASTALTQITGYEDEFWGNVRRSMNDCGVTLGTLELVLRTVREGERGRFGMGMGMGMGRKTMSKVERELERKAAEMAWLKFHVTAYHKMMGLCVQLVNVYSPPSHPPVPLSPIAPISPFTLFTPFSFSCTNLPRFQFPPTPPRKLHKIPLNPPRRTNNRHHRPAAPPPRPLPIRILLHRLTALPRPHKPKHVHRLRKGIYRRRDNNG